MIEFKNVNFSYDGATELALRDVSFRVGKGELAVLSAATGSGKSSVLKLLTAQEKVNSGEVIVGKYKLSAIKRSDIASYRRTIGCVFGDFQLLEEKTVFENIAFALEVQSKVKRQKIGDLVESILDRVGIHSLTDQFPRALSLGERQRTAIARALVTEPLLLLADNPTSMLDAESARGILDLFAIEHFRGMTIFITTTEVGPIDGFPPDTKYLSLSSGRLV
jgi:cell division transport system ATP-binding protein